MKTFYGVRDFKEQFGSKDAVKTFKSTLAKNGITDGSLFKEFFGSDKLAEMVPPAFLQQILIGALHNPVARNTAKIVPMNSHDSITLRRAKHDNEAQIITEGASADIDGVEFTKETYDYQKIVKRPGWTYEMLADYPLDLISINNQLMGAKITAKEDQLYLAELYDKTKAEYKNVVQPETPGVFGVEDLIELVTDVQGVKRFYKADTLIMNLKQYKQLMKMSDLRHANYFGSDVINKEGALTTFLGAKIFVANIYKKGPKGTFELIEDIYALDSTYASALIERQPMTIENWNLPERQMHNAMIFERVVPVVLQPEAIRRLQLS